MVKKLIVGLSVRQSESLGWNADLDSANFDFFFMRKPAAAPKVMKIHRCTLFVFSGSDIRIVNMKKNLSKYGDYSA